MMMWIYIATGFTGAWTFLFLVRWMYHQLGTMPSFAVHFSPKGGCQDAVVRELQRARHEVLVQAYSFTADPITLTLVEAKKPGPQAEVLLDRSNAQETYPHLHMLLSPCL